MMIIRLGETVQMRLSTSTEGRIIHAVFIRYQAGQVANGV